MKKNYSGFLFQGLEAQCLKEPGLKLIFEQQINSKSFKLESIWNPCCHPIKSQYERAVTGSCIWSRNDAQIIFHPFGKNSMECQRSIASPLGRDDIIQRLKKGQRIKCIRVSDEPFGKYQETMVTWQKEVVSRYGIKKLYYSLPLEEYRSSLVFLKDFVSPSSHDKLLEVLNEHYKFLRKKITDTINAEVIFINPMATNPNLTIEQSYMWPYLGNLDIEIGIEEFPEFKIPHGAFKIYPHTPPILFGIYDLEDDPYLKSVQKKKIEIPEKS